MSINSKLIAVHRAAQQLQITSDDLVTAIRRMPLDAMTAAYLASLREHVRAEIGDGTSPVLVARDLNERGFPQPDGSRWTAAEILELKD